MAKSDYFETKPWLKAKDVKSGAIFTIEKFEALKTRLDKNRGGKPSPCLRLKGAEMPFGLNSTNYTVLEEAFGSDETKWAGKKIRLIHAMVPNPQEGGKLIKGLRIEIV